jgi:hypothetical protein
MDAFDQLDQKPQGTQSTPATAPAASSAPATSTGDAFDQLDAQQKQDTHSTDPNVSGEITNDVGQKVIVPKGWGTDDEEPFSETLKRAVQYHQSLTPEQQQAALNAEAKTMPKKAVEAGIVGPLAAVGSYAGAAELIGVTGPTIAAGAKAVQAMAEAHPAAAKFIKKVLTGAIAGHSMGHTGTGAALGLLWDLL